MKMKQKDELILKWLKISLIIIGLFCGLYAPFELTRVLLDLNAGKHPIVPWFLGWEIAAIWVGFIMLIGCLVLYCLLIFKRDKNEN